MNSPHFFSELKRRNVIRAVILYVGAVWALAQGISQLGPSLGAPEWATRWFLVAASNGNDCKEGNRQAQSPSSIGNSLHDLVLGHLFSFQVRNMLAFV